MNLFTPPQLGSAAIEHLAATEAAVGEADSRAAYWESVCQRQGSELDDFAAALLLTRLDNERLSARVDLLNFQLAACRCLTDVKPVADPGDELATAMIEQQTHRGHNQ